MGKHDNVPDGNINEALEKHYQERIKELESQLEKSTVAIKDAMEELKKRDFRIRVLEAKADEFSKALAEMTVKAIMGVK